MGTKKPAKKKRVSAKRPSSSQKTSTSADARKTSSGTKTSPGTTKPTGKKTSPGTKKSPPTKSSPGTKAPPRAKTSPGTRSAAGKKTSVGKVRARRAKPRPDAPAPVIEPVPEPQPAAPSPLPREEVITPYGTRRRLPTADGAVLITGICGRLGRLLARRLHRVDRVIGVDRRPFKGKPKDIVHHQIDVRRKKTRDIFRSGEVRAVVHLGVLHDPRASDKEHHSWNVVAFQKLLDYLAQYNIPKLVVLSSANVYGPQPDNPQFLTEEAPLLGAQSFRGIRDLVELDMLAQSFFWRHPQTETVILRPCHILGAVRNAPSNYLRLERPMSILGFDPMVQVVHERDVVEALSLALRPGIRGIFNLRGPGELPLSRVLAHLGRKPVPVPAAVAKGTLDRLWRYRLTSFPPPELDHIRYVCMVDDTRARRVLGYRPAHTLEQTLRAVDSDR